MLCKLQDAVVRLTEEPFRFPVMTGLVTTMGFALDLTVDSEDGAEVIKLVVKPELHAVGQTTGANTTSYAVLNETGC